MRKFLLSLPVLVLTANTAFGACKDTTWVIQSGLAGFSQAGGNMGVYVPTALNSYISGCADTAMTLKIQYVDAAHGDSLKLDNEIIVNGRTGKTTRLTGSGTNGGPVTFVDFKATDPMLLDIRANNRAEIDNFGFARLTLDTAASANAINGSSVKVDGKGSKISNCFFWTADNASEKTPRALLAIVNDSVLVERSVFRAAPNGNGRTVAIHTSTLGNRVEIRSNIFYSTGLYLTSGSFHIYANTFAGSRNKYNAIILGSGITDMSKVAIQHNLFALKVDTLPSTQTTPTGPAPIVLQSDPASADSILKNAWSRSKTTTELAVNSKGAKVNLNTAPTQTNVVLPRGFSDYAPGKEFKQYPLTQLKTDSLLKPTDANFAVMPGIYSIVPTDWTGGANLPSIASDLPDSKMIFPGFRPIKSSSGWSSNAGIVVGASVLTDLAQVPSPIAASGFAAIKAPDSTKVRVTKLLFDDAYFGGKVTRPADLFFFFSDTLSKMASNNPDVLKTVPGVQLVQVTYNDFTAKGSDSSLTVPKEVRSGGDVYLKILDTRSDGQGPVLSSQAVTVTIPQVPSYPINDLSRPTLAVDTAAGTIKVSVTKQGTETIKSVIVVASIQGGGAFKQDTLVAPTTVGSKVTSTFKDLPRAVYVFTAIPVADLGGKNKLGSATLPSDPVSWKINAADNVYFTSKSCGIDADGTSSHPYCLMDSVLAAVKRKGGGTVIAQIVANDAFSPLVIGGTDDFPFTLVSEKNSGNDEYDQRAILRGTTTQPAISISRPGVTLKGFFIEMPVKATVPALDITGTIGSGGVIDGNIFRPTTKEGADGAAIGLAIGGRDMQIVNNIVWGYTTSIKASNSSAPNLRIMHNTFIAEKAFNNEGKTTGIANPGGGSFNGLIANNFFSGIASPFDETMAGKSPVLDHNVFTTSAPDLAGLSNSGVMDSVPRLDALDLLASDYKTGTSGLQTVMERFLDCNSFKPCVSLYAGSSSSTAGSSVITDVFDKQRQDKKEVGAYEAKKILNFPRGVLQVSLGKPGETSLVYTVTGKTFDPSEPESVYVFWYAHPNAPETLPAASAANRKGYSIAQLIAGPITDTAKNLKGNTLYTVYAALFDKEASSTDKIGYAYRADTTTEVPVHVGDITLSGPVTVVPPPPEFFTPANSLYQAFRTVITFSEPVSEGVVTNPIFAQRPADPPGLELANKPTFELGFGVKGMGVAGSKLTATATIEVDGNLSFDDLQLFVLPANAGSLPSFVPNWTTTHNSGKTQIIISGITSPENKVYAFGKIAAGGKSAQIQPAFTDAPVYDFQASDPQSVKLTIKGSGFGIANPLVLVTLVPAGGKASKSIWNKYHTKTLAFSSGLGNADQDVNAEQFFSYYQKAVAAEGTSPPPAGTVNAFTLDTTSLENFTSSVSFSDAPWTTISGAGDLPQTDINIPMTRDFKNKDDFGKATRSQEVVFTIFDGAKLTRSRGFIRTHFTDASIGGSEKPQLEQGRWNLFSYAWDEADTGSLSRLVGSTDKWRDENMRLWSYKGTGSGAASFTTYNGGQPNGFKFDSGAAVWSGAKDPYRPMCADGMSLDYQTFQLPLKAGQWNDIGLPFNFPIRWKDIADLSALPANTSVYRFFPLKGDVQARWERVTDSSVVHPWEGLSIKPAAAITLQIPVLDSSRSAQVVAKRAGAGILWARRIKASDANAMMILRIGKGAGEDVYPEAPNLPGQSFRVGLKRVNGDKEESFSEFVQSGDGGWQGHWSLQTSSAKDGPGIDLKLEPAEKGVPIYLVDALHKTVVALSADSATHLTADQARGNDYHLVAGDENYLNGVMEGLIPLNSLRLSNFPNPFAGSTAIRYVLPSGFGNAEFRLKIRDSRGRLVWERNIRSGNALNYLWDGRDMGNSPAPAGFYTLSVDALVPGKTTHHAVKRLLKL